MISNSPLRATKVLISVAVFLLYTFSPGLIAYAKRYEFFPDVPPLHKNRIAIEYLKGWGIIHGYPDGYYKPSKTVNRAELLKILVEGKGIDAQDFYDDLCFPDVPVKEWYTKYVCKAKNLGWVEGYPVDYLPKDQWNFKPGQTVNKVEALKIVGQAYDWELPEVTEKPYDDVSPTEWYSPYVYYGAQKDYLEEIGNTFRPAEGMSRAKIAEVIFRVLTVSKLEKEIYSADTVKELKEQEAEEKEAIGISDDEPALYDDVMFDLASDIDPDIDKDGLKNITEKEFGTNPFDADSDHDGVKDGDEKNWNKDTDEDGLINALDKDSDNDKLNDGEETLAGTDPLNADSDNDEINDGDEGDWNQDTDSDGLINALDDDSDNDEMKDGDELLYGTDVLDPDTDDDAVLDGQELAISTDPLDPDTDDDKLKDGQEAAYGAYFVEVEDIVSDDSLKKPDQKASKGYAVRVNNNPLYVNVASFQKKKSGTYKLYYRVKIASGDASNPSFYTTVSNQATHSFSNILENVDDEKVENIELAPKFDTGSKSYKDALTDTDIMPSSDLEDTADFRRTTSGIDAATYSKLLVTKPASISADNIYKWYSTQLFDLNYSSNTDISFSVDASTVVYLDKLLLVKVDNIAYRTTDPLEKDSDFDNIADGEESALDTFWVEAEDYVYQKSQIHDNVGASNSKDVIAKAGSKDLISIPMADYPAGMYVVYFIRSKQISGSTENSLKVTANYHESAGSEECNSSDLYQWNYCGLEFRLPEDSDFNIIIAQTDASDTVYLDKIMIKRQPLYPPFTEMVFKPVTVYEMFDPRTDSADEEVIYHLDFFLDEGYYYEDDPITDKSETNDYGGDFVPMEGIEGGGDYKGRQVTMQLPIALPVSNGQGAYTADPMDCDTDLDGYRPADGAISGSTGYLTDGKEIDLAFNHFNQDTDDDGLPDSIDYNPLSDDTDDDALIDSIEDSSEPFGVNDHPNDPDYLDFLDDDTDNDGILDGNEDKNYNAALDIGETNPNDADTDNDNITDGVEIGLAAAQGDNTTDWQGDQDPNSTTDPTQADSDSDSLLDGDEDANRDGKIDGDSNRNGVIDNGETWAETNPNNPDSDGDSLNDDTDPNPLSPDYPDLEVLNMSVTPDVIMEYDSADVRSTVKNDGIIDIDSEVFVNIYLGNPDSDDYLQLETFYFGDGFDAAESAEIDYTLDYWNYAFLGTAGDYDIYIKAYSDVKEGSDSNNKASSTVEIRGTPTVDAGENLEVAFESEVTFEGAGASDSSSIVLYEWDFESDGIFDDSSASTGSATYTYPDSGAYIATLKATDNYGISAQDQVTVTVREEDHDSDGDHLSDLYENEIGSDPDDIDSDDDELFDYEEVDLALEYDTTPDADIDNDGLINILDPDSDNDGYLDWEEKFYSSNPYLTDTDNDGLDDYTEGETYGTSFLRPDTDDDGMSDYDETQIYGTNPFLDDTDSDGIGDGTDLQPLVNAENIAWSDEYLPGLVRFEQEYRVYGLKGRSEIWDYHYNWLGEYTGKTKAYSGTQGTRNSSITNSKVMDIINDYYGGSDYSPISNTKTNNWENTDIYYSSRGDDGWHRRKYIIYYSELVEMRDVKFKNKQAIRRQDLISNEMPYFAVLPISLTLNKKQSLIIQYKIDQVDDYSHHTDDQHYAMPAFMYSLYPSNNFNSDSNSAKYSNLAFATEIDTDWRYNYYQVEVKIPADEANVSSLYLVLYPIHVVKNGAETSKQRVDARSIGIAAYAKKIYVSDTKEMTLAYGSISSLNGPIPSTSSFNNADFVQETPVQLAEKKKPEGEAEAYEITTGKNVDRIIKAAGVVKTLTESIVTATAKVAKIDDLPDTHWLKSAKYAQVGEAFTVASAGAVLATDGVESFVAFREGNTIKGTVYAAKTGLGVLKEVSTLSIAAKSGALKALGSVKGQAVLTIVIGSIQVGWNLWEASQTDDEIKKMKCYEGASAAAIDAGISVIPVYGQVIQGSWTVAIAVFELISPPDEFTKAVCSSPGSAITFVFEYFFTNAIPSAVAEHAIKYAAGEVVSTVNAFNNSGQPTIFVEP